MYDIISLGVINKLSNSRCHHQPEAGRKRVNTSGERPHYSAEGRGELFHLYIKAAL